MAVSIGNFATRMLAIAAVAIGFAAPAEQAEAQCVAPAPGIQGIWHGNDGGTYRIQDGGSMIRWEGRSGDNGRSWVNRFVGTRVGNVVTGEWADVGRPSHGRLTIRMDNDHLLVRLESTGPFGGSRWTRPVPSHGCNNDTVLQPAED